MINLFIINTAIFLAVAVLHGIRLLTQAPATIGGIEVALWLSALALVGASALAWLNLKALPKLGRSEVLRLIQALAVIDAFVSFYSWQQGLAYLGFAGTMFLWWMIVDVAIIVGIDAHLKKK